MLSHWLGAAPGHIRSPAFLGSAIQWPEKVQSRRPSHRPVQKRHVLRRLRGFKPTENAWGCRSQGKLAESGALQRRPCTLKAEPIAPSVQHGDRNVRAGSGSSPGTTGTKEKRGMWADQGNTQKGRFCSPAAPKYHLPERESAKPFPSHKTLVKRSFAMNLRDFLPAWNSVLVPSPHTTPTNSWSRKNSLRLKESTVKNK